VSNHNHSRQFIKGSKRFLAFCFNDFFPIFCVRLVVCVVFLMVDCGSVLGLVCLLVCVLLLLA